MLVSLIPAPHLFPAFSWLVTYCRRPANSMGYFLNTAPHRLARPGFTKGHTFIKAVHLFQRVNGWCNRRLLWSHEEMVVSSCFIFSFSGLAKASMMQSEDNVKWSNTDRWNLSIFRALPNATHPLRASEFKTCDVGYRPGHHSWGTWEISRNPPQEQWGCRTTGFETTSGKTEEKNSKLLQVRAFWHVY